MSDIRLPIGKYRGRALSDVVSADPDYISWLLQQSELLKRHPNLARGLADIGASGDETPVHNAIQAYFLDDGVCANLVRALWGPNAGSEAAQKLISWKRRSEIDELVGRTSYDAQRKTASIIRELVATKLGIRQIKVAALLSDTELERLCRSCSYPSPLAGLLTSSVAKSREYIDARLHDLIRSSARAREKLAGLRASLVAIRQKYDAISTSDVRKVWTQKIKRFEEVNGSDVHLRYTLDCYFPDSRYPDDVTTFDMWVEIKPFLGDDFPSALRQMELQRRQASDKKVSGSRFVLVVGKFGARGVNLDQLRKIFACAQIDVVMLAELGCEMPERALHGPDSLPLFQS